MLKDKKHHKHPPLKRPEIGNYHKLEWAIYGTTCGAIEAFYNSIHAHFSNEYRLTYVDADHGDSVKDTSLQVGKKQYKQNHIFEANSFDDKLNLALSQAVFINGNHYPGQRQIVIINPEKKDSLYRRVEQLDNIELVIKEDEDSEIYDFVQAKMTEDSLVLLQNQTKEIFDFFGQGIVNAKAPLKALILAGGKSTRMKEDKSKLKYHNQTTQEEHLARMCQNLGVETFISKSTKEEQTEINGIQVIKDRYIDMGPFGAILSAFLHDPNSAWLVLACDLPYMSEKFIDRLLKERSIVHFATAYRVKENPFPEPLIAIYEPEIYRRMLSFLTLGYACPRKVLINSEVKHVILDDEQIAFNANTPGDKETVINNLNAKA